MRQFEILIVLILTIVLFAWSLPGRHYEFKIKKISANTSGPTSVQQDTLNGTDSVTGKTIPGNGLESDTLIFITGTGRDTTRVYKSAEFMTFAVFLDDTSSGGDSVGIDLLIFRASMAGDRIPPYAEFTLEDSLNFATDNAWTRKVYTTAGSNRANSRLWFGVAKGTSTNKQKSASKVLLRFEGYNSNPELRN